ncbi:membrane fusion protein, cobalt-zinc-cadmium efflux system [Geoalkalibacter ferrihydriticus]|uniref:Membrane fusion protein, cobalt-zinc-cadmium efflux system n=1 Tax=Geoalkalibacter ferrihydriticus TaxID=392333 RepID=A0A1G9QQK5_9BACT|nr:efflux RND transporter periplasmic adaptor subunit [Geoalkalibacter ferrihydriticus]SDM13296.1 membrane fusion protein, cobalt-zinc-cadmium efflux system [Geoalkalibacter ferrihydriticus]
MAMSSKSKKILLILALILALVAGYFAGSGRHTGHEPGAPGEPTANGGKVQYTCGMHPFIIQDEPGTCPICGMRLTPMRPSDEKPATAERQIKHWASPMDPTYVRDEPGQDYMGHDLVPVYEDGAVPGQVLIDPVTMQNMGVRIAPVERRDLSRTIRTVGTIEYDEPHRYSINNKIDGWVERLHVNQTGQTVRKGQALLDIYSPELVSAQEEFLLALRNRDRLAQSSFPEVAAGGERLLEAARTRLKYWDISERQIAELEKSRQARKTLTLFSPHAGIVTEKRVFEGMRIMAGEDLFQISDLSRVWIISDIYEFEAPWVRVGLQARVELPFAAEAAREGEITFLYPYLRAETRTLQARIEFDNPDLQLKPGMYANVFIAADPVMDVLAIPSEAVLRSGKRERVFVALGEGRFEPRTVTVGVTDEDGYVQIKSGLRMGEDVVVSAQFMLDSEAKLQEAIQKMTPLPEAPEPEPEIDLEDLF